MLRPSPDLPAGSLPEGVDGRWIDLDDVPHTFWKFWQSDGPDSLIAVAIDERYETREDGAEAQVFEVRKAWP